jgi:hypothetical protein
MNNEVRTLKVAIVDPFGGELYSFTVTSTGLESLSWVPGEYTVTLDIGANHAIPHAVKVTIV